MSRKVRVRFAPSPTGPLHIGGVRTALFNYLFAKKHGGDMLLRIEDTDQTRFVPGAENYIMESLEWCGIRIDEGIREGGNCGPYRQSDRKEIYKKYAAQLIESGNAYYAFDTPEELEKMRDRLEAEKSSVRQYGPDTRLSMCNSLSLPAEEVKNKLEKGEQYVIRFKMPVNQEIAATDIIRGRVVVNSSTLDDKVLFKSDGMPTYHLANIVDDYLMHISHVIRGEEWLPSLPLHVMLYRSFGWENEMPQFAHLPLLLKPNGKGKLSKRDGDQMGFPVFPLQWTDPQTGEKSRGYREDGYLPEAFVNMLALLGWNPGTEQEIFTIEQLAEQFDLDKISKSGAKFSPEKAHWFNQHYIKEKSNTELAQFFMPILNQRGIDADFDFVEKVTEFAKERIVLLPDFWEQTSFFFETPKEYNPAVVKKNWKDDSAKVLTDIGEILKNISETDYSSTIPEEKVKEYITANNLGFGKVMNAFRLILTGTGGGPHLFDIVSTIGKDETLIRIEKGVREILLS